MGQHNALILIDRVADEVLMGCRRLLPWQLVWAAFQIPQTCKASPITWSICSSWAASSFLMKMNMTHF
jgi:hypothetical protein